MKIIKEKDAFFPCFKRNYLVNEDSLFCKYVIRCCSTAWTAFLSNDRANWGNFSSKNRLATQLILPHRWTTGTYKHRTKTLVYTEDVLYFFVNIPNSFQLSFVIHTIELVMQTEERANANVLQPSIEFIVFTWKYSSMKRFQLKAEACTKFGFNIW